MSLRNITYLLICVILQMSCSVNKFVPEGEYLLNDVKIISTTNHENAVKAKGYVRQMPNAKLFNLVKLPLYTYSLSGHDTAQWRNKVLRRLGEAPVIFDSAMSEKSRQNIRDMLVNDGYFHATVDFECLKNDKRKRADAVYYLHERERYYIASIDYDMKDEVVGAIVLADTASSLLRPGMPFSVDNMEFERRRIAEMLRNRGYYRFQKEYITYVADTAHHSNKVRLTMKLGKFIKERDAEPEPHRIYRVGRIYYVSDAGLRLDDALLAKCDTIEVGDYSILSNDDLVVRPSVLMASTHVKPGSLYSQYDVDRTYNSFANLSALKYTTVRMMEVPGSDVLDCYIMFERNKRMSVDFELDGTNTAGDFGVAASVTIADKNLFKGSEQLSLRVFTAYEAVSGLSGYSGGDYLEYGAETSLRLMGGLPAVVIPVRNRTYSSSTMLSLKFNSQKRPEFDRHILSGTWSYSWSSKLESMNTLELLDVNYIYVPWISDTFKKDYLDSISNRNSILKYNYENLLITKLGYTYTYNSSLKKSNRFNPYAYSWRRHLECSGNLLY